MFKVKAIKTYGNKLIVVNSHWIIAASHLKNGTAINLQIVLFWFESVGRTNTFAIRLRWHQLWRCSNFTRPMVNIKTKYFRNFSIDSNEFFLIEFLLNTLSLSNANGSGASFGDWRMSCSSEQRNYPLHCETCRIDGLKWLGRSSYRYCCWCNQRLSNE